MEFLAILKRGGVENPYLGQRQNLYGLLGWGGPDDKASSGPQLRLSSGQSKWSAGARCGKK